MMWYAAVYPYVNNIQTFNCPSNTYEWTGNYTGRMCYGWNLRLINVPLARITEPAATAMIADVYEDPGADSQTYYFTTAPVMTGSVIRSCISDLHNGGANITLADGHAKWYRVARGSHDIPGVKINP